MTPKNELIHVTFILAEVLRGVYTKLVKRLLEKQLEPMLVGESTLNGFSVDDRGCV